MQRSMSWRIGVSFLELSHKRDATETDASSVDYFSTLHFSGKTLGLLHLIRADTVLAYQRIRLFVWANSMKTVVFDTYQEIPDTGHF